MFFELPGEEQENMPKSLVRKFVSIASSALLAVGLLAASQMNAPAAQASLSTVPTSQVELGTMLVGYYNRGLLTTDCTIDAAGVVPCADSLGGREAIYKSEILPLSLGQVPAPGTPCSIDTRVLQLLVLVIDHFQQRVNVTDLERYCVGSQLSKLQHGAQAGHGGWAIDIDSIGGAAVNGSSAKDSALLAFLLSIKPTTGSLHVGQTQCVGHVNYSDFSNFQDDCTHQHIDFSTTSVGLNVPTGSGTAGSPLFQLHTDGAVFAYTGSPCGPSGCNGWGQINGAGSGVSKMAADNGNLYILLSNGAIFKYNGNPCDSTGCHGWTQLNGAGSSATQITAEAGALWMLRSDGAIFKYNGNPCGSSGCNGWTQYNGAGSGATQIVAGTNSAGVPAVNMLRSDGAIYQSTAPCGSTCSGWAAINGAGSGTTQMTARGKDLFILLSSGAIFQYTQQMCTASGCHGWAQLNGGGSGTVEISAGANAAGMSVVNMRRNDGAIFQYTGQACDANGCRGWAQLNGAGSGVVQMTGSDSNLFIRRNDGALFQYTQQACDANGCRGWAQLDATASTSQIAG